MTWPTKKLGEIVNFISGNQNINKGRATPNGKYPAYSASGQDIFLDTYEHEGPAIIVSWIGARCGKCFLANGKWTAIANTQILKIKNEKECDYKYLFYFLNDEKKWPRIGGAQPYISKNGAKKIEVPLPPLKIQKRIVARIEELFDKIDKAKELREKALEETEKIFQSTLQEIFSKAEKKWELKKLGDISSVFAGSSAPQDQRYFENGKYPFVRVQDLGRFGKTKNLTEIKDKVNDLALKEFHLVLARKGTILFPKSGAAIFTNSRAILGVDAYIVSHLAAIFPHNSIALTDWIFYWLYQFDMAKLTKTTALPSLKLSQIKTLGVPLPPLSEQKKIVAYLDNLREKVEKLKKYQEEQLKDLEELKKSILEKAFRGELL